MHNKMKIVVTGAGGMLGRTLVSCLESRKHKVRGMPREELDVSNCAAVKDLIIDERPDMVIHTAAYTKVDQAESEPELAYLINAYGTENIALTCNSLNIPMVYISTDYVFDGNNDRPYTTWDKTNPLSIYGKSKLAGEQAVCRHLNRFYILRTSWLYGPFGSNFVETILNLAESGGPLRIVSDQTGTPTCTLTLSETIADLISTERWGIYHATDGGVTSWYEFAKAILRNKDIEIRPIETKDMPRPATRPKYSVLDKTTLVRTIGREMVPWQESLESFLDVRTQTQPA